MAEFYSIEVPKNINGAKFLTTLKEKMNNFEANGGYIPSKHRMIWRRIESLISNER